MNIRDKIGSLIAAMSTVEEPISFAYARKSEYNITADDLVFPNALFIEPDSFGWVVSPSNGTLKPYTNIFVQFVTRMPDQEFPTKDEIGRDANYRNGMIEEMKAKAEQFIYLIMNDEAFENVSNDIPAIPVIEAYDANTFGVEINIAKLIHTFPLPC